jgi:hypothetical protein
MQGALHRTRTGTRALDRPEKRPGWTPFVVVAAVYALVATWNLALPGVYMDEVNPDYLAVKLLNPAHQPIIAWVLQGNYLFGNRVPWMVSLYHGSQTFWLGLPLFWLLGTSVESLRLAHAALALGVLAGLFHLLRRARLASLPAAACCGLLALDPSFSYAFRTQSYITLAPSAWLLVSAAMLMRQDNATPRHWTWSGILAGFAATGYFVQGFFLLALLPAAWLATRSQPSRPGNARMRWFAGLALGLLPVALGYALLMRHVGGPTALVEFFDRQQSALHAFSSTLPLPQRIGYAIAMLEGVVGNAWHHAMMFREWKAVPGSGAKTTCLLLLPPLLWLLAERRRSASFACRLAIAMPAAFVAIALVFGNRLAGHHYVTVLPWLYAGLAIALRDALAGMQVLPGSWRRIGVAVLVFAAAALNLVGQVAEARTLRRTGGVGLMSDAINHLADDLDAMPQKPFVFFPDWGLSLPIAFLTGGRVGMDASADFARARRLLCTGRDVDVALIDDRDARREAWTRALGWDAPQV